MVCRQARKSLGSFTKGFRPVSSPRRSANGGCTDVLETWRSVRRAETIAACAATLRNPRCRKEPRSLQPETGSARKLLPNRRASVCHEMNSPGRANDRVISFLRSYVVSLILALHVVCRSSAHVLRSSLGGLRSASTPELLRNLSFIVGITAPADACCKSLIACPTFCPSGQRATAIAPCAHPRRP